MSKYLIIILLIPISIFGKLSSEAEKEIIYSTCRNVGFEEKTEAFGDCFLKIKQEIRKKEEKNNEYRKFYEKQVSFDDLEKNKIKQNCSNIGFKEKTEVYGECYLKERSKLILNKRLLNFGVNPNDVEFTNSTKINKDEITLITTNCLNLGFEKKTEVFGDCFLSQKINLENNKRNVFVLAKIKDDQKKLELEIKKRELETNIVRQRAIVQSTIATQNKSNHEMDAALDTIVLLLSVGLTLYSLGAFGGVPSGASSTADFACGGFMQCGFDWNPLGLNQIPM